MTYNFFHSYEYFGFGIDNGFNNREFDVKYVIPDWYEKCNTTSYCNIYPNADVCDKGPNLPIWPNTFSVSLEAKIKQQNETIFAEDMFFDYENNRKRVIEYPYIDIYCESSNNNGDKCREYEYVNYSNHFLEDGILLWKWKQYNGDSVNPNSNTIDDCMLEIVEEEIEELEWETFEWDKNIQHIIGIDMFSLWTNNLSKQKYYGKHTVRGIPCHAWKSEFVQALVVEDDSSDTESSESKTKTNTDNDDGSDDGDDSDDSDSGDTDDSEEYYKQNYTVTFYFMQDRYKPKRIYGDFGVPVRCEVIGTVTTVKNGIDTSVQDVNIEWDIINFFPFMPDDFWFTPPSNVTCDFGKFCKSIDDEDPDEDSDDNNDDDDIGGDYSVFSDLCNGKTSGDKSDYDDGYMATTGCYISSCGDIVVSQHSGEAETDSGEGTRHCDYKSANNVPAYMWVCLVAAFVLGLAIGLIYHFQEQRKKKFQQLEQRE